MRDRGFSMDRLSSINGLLVRQQKEWVEIVTGFETTNKYIVSDLAGRSIYLAEEVAGSRMLRWLLKASRPFTIAVLGEDGHIVLRVVRPFRFYFHRAEIFDAQGRSLGMVQRRFSFLRRIYSVLDGSGQVIVQLFGPILHPWTFHIRNDGIDFGMITKKWSGLLKEGFTDADDFGVTFPVEWGVKLKALCFGAVFLIDQVHFEDRINRHNMNNNRD